MTEPVVNKTPIKAAPSTDPLAQFRQILPQLNDEQRRALSDEYGITIPVAYDGQDIKAVRYGYRCKGCNAVGLKFRGDKPPPTGVPFDQLLWIQDVGKANDPSWRRAQNKSRPRCMQCGQVMATDPYSGGIKDDRVVTIDQYERARDADIARRSRRVRNYERDSARAAQ